MKRVLTCLIAVIVVSALQSSSAFAQGAWPVPAKTPNTPVTRGNYTTIGYPLPITTFVGRYLDSEQTRDYQQTFRTVRANKIRIVPERNRIYMLIGSSLFAYNLDTFFTRLAAGEQMMGATQIPVSPANTCNTCRKPELPLDYFLKPDSFFYAENGGGWITPFVDGQDRLYDFDTDDRNNVYMAAEIFGWGVAVDGGGTGLNRLFGPQYAPGANDVIPMKIMSVKTSGGQYYVIVSSDFGGSAVWNATDINAAVKQPTGGHEIVAYAKAQSGTRIALVTPAGNVEFYTNDTMPTGAGPFQSFHNADGYFGVDSDGTNFYATSYSAAAGLTISVFTPNGNSYVETKYPVGGTYVNFMPKVRWGANYLTVYGPQQITCSAPCINGNGWNVRIFSLPNGVPTEVSINNYVAAYYSTLLYSKPDGGYYSHPPSYMFMHDSLIYRSGSKYYFFVAARGLGDVYEIKGADTLTASVKRVGDTVNPNSKAPAGSGPYYGDNMVLTALTSSQASFLINWNFGDGTTGSSVTGLPDVAHQYGGLTAATLPATFNVTATSALDANMTDHINVTVKAPTVRVGVKGTPYVITQGGSELPIVAGDTLVDASDGYVESHFNDWTIDGGAPIRTTPLTEPPIGDCGAHTLSFAAHYGPYDSGTMTPKSTEALYTIGPVSYSVKPFVAQIAAPTSDATNVIFTSATRVGSGASVPGGPGTAVSYVWRLLDANDQVLLTQNADVSLGTIPSFVVPKTFFENASGRRVQLVLATNPASIGPACSPFAQSVAVTPVLAAPQATDISVTGCGNVGSACTLSVVGTAQPDWSYSWSVAGLPGANTATYSPAMPTEGNYTINLTVSNALGATNLSKTLTVGPRLCSSAPNENNTAISYSGPVSHCYSGVACNAGEQISFIMSPYNWTPSACDKYTWNFGDGSAQSTAVSPKHAYASNGNYQVTLTLVGGVSTAVVHATVVVGSVVQPPPPPPPPPPPTGCGALGPGSLYIGFYGQQSACSLTNPNCNADENIYFNIYGNGYDVNCGLSFNWNFGDTGASSTSTLQAPLKKYTVGGNYTVTVSVRTPNNSQQTYSAAIKINGGGTPPPPGGGCGLTNASYYVGYYGPTSFCTANAPGCVRDENIAFSALPFGSPCNSATFSWNFGDNATATGQQPRHKYATDGLYKVVLTIADGATTVTASEDVKVGNSGVQPPPSTRIDFTTTAVAGKENWYEFSAFSIPAGKITQWHWDFGDGSGSDLATIKHGYPDAGKYTVTLTSPQLPGVVVKRDTIGQPHRRAAGR